MVVYTCMCVDRVFHSVQGSMESSMSMQHSFHFVAKFSNFFLKMPWGKDSNTFVFTKQVEKNVKKFLGKRFLCVKKIGGKTLSTHMCADRSLHSCKKIVFFDGKSALFLWQFSWCFLKHFKHCLLHFTLLDVFIFQIANNFWLNHFEMKLSIFLSSK